MRSEQIARLEERTWQWEAKTFINRLLDLHEKVYGMSFGANCVLPHLDWSHPWTDEEILKEIGLPEDFLGEE